MKPLWLLDVDGVINAVTGNPDRTVWPDWVRGEAIADGAGWRIWYSPSVVEAICRLRREGLAEIRWLTTWGHDANDELADVCGLPQLDVVEFDHEYEMHEDWWKLGAVQQIHDAEGPRPLVWTDDDLRTETRAQDWVSDRYPDRLLIAPRCHLGLTPAHLREIEAFCRSWVSVSK